MAAEVTLSTGIDGFVLRIDGAVVDDPACANGWPLYLTWDRAADLLAAARDALPQLAATLANPSQPEAR